MDCLQIGHFSNRCRAPKACTVPVCDYEHHTLMHRFYNADVQEADSAPTDAKKFRFGTSSDATAASGKYSDVALKIDD